MTCLQGGVLFLGVTATSPEKWRDEEEERIIYYIPQTWLIDTRIGETWRPRDRAGVCQRWQQEVSDTDYRLSDGDLLSMSLCDDTSMSITYNNTEVPQVFTDLPDKPLWVVIDIYGGKLEVLQTGEDDYHYININIINLHCLSINMIKR